MKGETLVAAGVVLLLLAVSAGKRPDPPKPGPGPGPRTPRGPDPSVEWSPYIPTPHAVAIRAMELLQVMHLGEQRIEPDPSGKHAEVLFNCATHPPNAQHAQPHKGVDAWTRKQK